MTTIIIIIIKHLLSRVNLTLISVVTNLSWLVFMLFFNLISIPKHYFLYKKIVWPCRESSLVHTWPKNNYIIFKISRHIKKTRRRGGGGGHEKKKHSYLLFAWPKTTKNQNWQSDMNKKKRKIYFNIIK